MKFGCLVCDIVAEFATVEEAEAAGWTLESELLEESICPDCQDEEDISLKLGW